jgi:hypothetical protein
MPPHAAISVSLNLGRGIMFDLQLTYLPELSRTSARMPLRRFASRVPRPLVTDLRQSLRTLPADCMGGSVGVSVMLFMVVGITFCSEALCKRNKNELPSRYCEGKHGLLFAVASTKVQADDALAKATI